MPTRPPVPPNKKAPQNKNARNRVRIVGGEMRSRIIEFPDAPGLRPTPDRVRETLFNWLGQSLAGRRCLDLFAGSGALGFEAASRGAEEVVMIETDRAAYTALQENQKKLAAIACKPVRVDAIVWLAGDCSHFDVIFADPPFASGLLVQVLPLLAARLSEGGHIYAEWGEAPGAWLAAHPEIPLQVQREGRAGNSFFALLSLQTNAEDHA